MPPKYLPDDVTILDKIQKHRLQSLLAVDEMVEKIIKKLQVQEILNNTYVLFTSDNGFHIGMQFFIYLFNTTVMFSRIPSCETFVFDLYIPVVKL